MCQGTGLVHLSATHSPSAVCDVTNHSSNERRDFATGFFQLIVYDEARCRASTGSGGVSLVPSSQVYAQELEFADLQLRQGHTTSVL